MRALYLQMASMLGLDPITFMVLGLLAATCAFWMKEMMPNPWMAFVFYPLLLVGGALAVALAAGLGLTEAIEVSVDEDGSIRAVSWKEVFDALVPIIMIAIVGMSLIAVGLIQLVRSLQRFV